MKMVAGNDVWIWVAAFAMAGLFFYGLDHMIMAWQDLPLNLDMTPVQ